MSMIFDLTIDEIVLIIDALETTLVEECEGCPNKKSGCEECPKKSIRVDILRLQTKLSILLEAKRRIVSL